MLRLTGREMPGHPVSAQEVLAMGSVMSPQSKPVWQEAAGTISPTSRAGQTGKDHPRAWKRQSQTSTSQAELGRSHHPEQG